MRILIIEDDIALCDAVQYHLKREGYEVDICHDGDDGLRWACQQAHDLVILDRMLPALNGLSVLSQIREKQISTPVLIVTALDGVGDRVQGLDAGADDYLVKPFAIEELLARIRALSRRPPQWENNQILQYDGLSLNLATHCLQGPSGVCTLSKREAQLLEVLMRNALQTLPRSILFSRVWGLDAPVEDGNLDNYIHFLRRRLRGVGSELSIHTIRGIGYCLTDATTK